MRLTRFPRPRGGLPSRFTRFPIRLSSLACRFSRLSIRFGRLAAAPGSRPILFTSLPVAPRSLAIRFTRPPGPLGSLTVASGSRPHRPPAQGSTPHEPRGTVQPPIEAPMALTCKTHRSGLVAAAALFGAIALVGPQGQARADEVSPSGKGIVGGALLGAEVVTIVESLVGVRSGWAYLIGGVLGAGAGGVGGYFVEQNSSDGKAPVYMLAGGLALVIPAVVLSLDATRFRPEEGAAEDKAPTGPLAEPGVPGGSVVTPPAGATGGAPAAPPAAPAPAPAPPPQSLLDGYKGEYRLGLPVPSVVPMFSAVEAKTYGLTRNDAEFKMPVLHISF